MFQFSDQDRRFIQKNLVSWFQKNQRKLPWRKKYDPYGVWISEIMLQQTQVKTALPYFERWMKELPSINSVARAPQDKILKLWEGLGYYSRARNLQKAAQLIIKKHNGRFPNRYADILALPGIGKYSAGAISSIAFNRNKPVVDGNVIRVMARLANFSENTRLPQNIKQFWGWAEKLIPSGLAREFNQGLMELGALVCTPKKPNCSHCPVKKVCKGSQNGTAAQLPNRGEKTKNIPITVTLAVICKNGKIFIQKRPEKGLMGGLWEFPGGKTRKNETGPNAIRREIKEELSVTIKNVKKIARIRHNYTKFNVDLHCYSADLDKGKIRLNFATKGKWVTPKSLTKFAFPAADKKLINDLKKIY